MTDRERLLEIAKRIDACGYWVRLGEDHEKTDAAFLRAYAEREGQLREALERIDTLVSLGEVADAVDYYNAWAIAHKALAAEQPEPSEGQGRMSEKKKKIAVISQPPPDILTNDNFKCPVCHLHQIGGKCTCVRPKAAEPTACPNCYDLQRQLAVKDAEVERLRIQSESRSEQITLLRTELAEAKARADALDWLEESCCDLRAVDEATGGGDYDVAWEVIEHHMAEPQERQIGYGKTPLEAIQLAERAGEE